jgi:hypothetical protein
MEPTNAESPSNRPLGRDRPTVGQKPVRGGGAGMGGGGGNIGGNTATSEFDPTTARYWAWDKPLGTAAFVPQIIQMVRVQVHFLSGREAADKVCDLIVDRRLRSGEVCILLQGFGEGGGDPGGKYYHVQGRTPLFLNWNDGLVRGTSEYWWNTPWMEHGIAHTGAWMEEFINRYQTRQRNDQLIPDPSRFHFDSEGGVRVEQTARGAISAFHAMRRDSRWATEKIVGLNKTLKQLYSEAGTPSYRHQLAWYKEQNKEWAIWYQSICIEACDAAMNEVAYQPIRETWPSCKSSNYGTSTSFDGVNGRFDVDGMNPWFKYTHKGYADMQAPVCYTPVCAMTSGRPLLAAADTLEVFEGRLVAMADSFEAPGPTSIAPWLELPGSLLVRRGEKVLQTEADSYAEIHMIGELGVREFIIWSNPDPAADPQNWDALAAIVQGGVPASVASGRNR